MKRKMNGSFAFKIKSTDTVTRTIVLIPGSYPVMGLSGADWAGRVVHYHDPAAIKNAGMSEVDFILDDGEIDDTASKMLVSAINSKFKVAHFLQHIKTNPYRIGEISIQADNADVFSEKLTLKRDLPVAGTSERFIYLQQYFRNTQFQDNKIVINDANIVISDEILLTFSIPAGREVIISFNQMVKL